MKKNGKYNVYTASDDPEFKTKRAKLWAMLKYRGWLDMAFVFLISGGIFMFLVFLIGELLRL